MRNIEKKRYHVPSLEKGLLILVKLARSNQPLRITDIHEQMDIPKTSVFTILSTLEKMEFIEKTDESRYRTTMKIYHLGLEVLLQHDVRRVARPFMERLAAELRYTVHLAILSNDMARYIDKVNGPTFVQFGTRIGQSIGLHYSAVGKVLAAYLPEPKLDAILNRKPLERMTDHTITSTDDFKRFLAEVRNIGYATEDEEGTLGIRCIGAPIFDIHGQVVAAMSVTAVRSDLPSIHFQHIGTELKMACLQISRQMGYVPISSGEALR